MSQKYEERIKRAKAHNNETKKRIQENTQQIYEERLSCDNRADDIEMNAAEEDSNDVHLLQDINGLPPNNLIERTIASVIKHNFKCNVLFN